MAEKIKIKFEVTFSCGGTQEVTATRERMAAILAEPDWGCAGCDSHYPWVEVVVVGWGQGQPLPEVRFSDPDPAADPRPCNCGDLAGPLAPHPRAQWCG